MNRRQFLGASAGGFAVLSSGCLGRGEDSLPVRVRLLNETSTIEPVTVTVRDISTADDESMGAMVYDETYVLGIGQEETIDEIELRPSGEYELVLDRETYETVTYAIRLNDDYRRSILVTFEQGDTVVEQEKV